MKQSRTFCAPGAVLRQTERSEVDAAGNSLISARAFDFGLCQNDESPQILQVRGLSDQIHYGMNQVSTQFIKTLRLKVKPGAYAWLNAAAREVNQVVTI